MKAYLNQLNINGEKKFIVTINQNECEQVSKKESVDSIHHIQILDRSGSMTPHINDLITDVQNTMNVIGKNDYLTIIWFSSPGQFKTLVKGAKKDTNIKTLLDSIRSTLGTTCFSDPITEAKNIVFELKQLCPNFSITLFTDGLPCVPWSEAEEKTRINKVLEELSGHVMAMNTIGYGPYCDEELLKHISSYSEFGQFVHSDNIKDYSEIFKNNFEKIQDVVCEKVCIETSNPVIYLNRKLTKLFRAKKMTFNKLSKDKNQFFIVGDSDFSFMYNNEIISTKTLKEESNDVTMQNFLYAYAYVMFCEGRRNLALNVYGKNLFDKEPVDLLQSCFTPSEIEEVRKVLERMIVNTSARWVNGKCPNNYLPKKDAHCVLDILNEIATGNCYYVPFSKHVDEYERITRKTEDNQKTFTQKKGLIYSKVEEFIFHKTKLNISVMFQIPGTIKINDEDFDLLGIKEVDATMFRTHNIIKDGSLNMKSMALLMPEEICKSLKSKATKLSLVTTSKKELIELEKEHGMPYVYVVVSFRDKPMINQLYLDESMNSKKLLEVCMDEVHLEARQSMCNYFLKKFKELNPIAEKQGLFQKMTKEAIEILKNKYGVTKEGWYYPKDTHTASTKESDAYRIKEMDFAFKGMQKLPSVKDYMELAKGAKKTLGMTILDQAYQWMASKISMVNIKYDVKFRDDVQALLKFIKNELHSIREHLAGIKLAKFLSHDDFVGLETDDKGNRFYKDKDSILLIKCKEGWEYL